MVHLQLTTGSSRPVISTNCVSKSPQNVGPQQVPGKEVKILVILNPTGYMLAFSGFASIHLKYIHRFL